MRTAIKVNASKQASVKRQALRLLTINGYQPGSYNPHRVKAWLIHTEVHFSFVAIGSCEQEAIDNCIDSGLWDAFLVEPDTLAEYMENDWLDSFVSGGNAGEYFWAEHLYMSEVEL